MGSLLEGQVFCSQLKPIRHGEKPSRKVGDHEEARALLQSFTEVPSPPELAAELTPRVPQPPVAASHRIR